MKFTSQQIKKRRLRRLAEIIHDHWEEGSGMDTRYFDHPFIHNNFVVAGQSTEGGEYREHVVPRVYLRDKCLEMYENGASVDDVTEVLLANLCIAMITSEQAALLNKRFRDTMPLGWVVGKSDPFERLHTVGIEIVPKGMVE